MHVQGCSRFKLWSVKYSIKRFLFHRIQASYIIYKVTKAVISYELMAVTKKSINSLSTSQKCPIGSARGLNEFRRLLNPGFGGKALTTRWSFLITRFELCLRADPKSIPVIIPPKRMNAQSSTGPIKAVFNACFITKYIREMMLVAVKNTMNGIVTTSASCNPCIHIWQNFKNCILFRTFIIDLHMWSKFRREDRHSTSVRITLKKKTKNSIKPVRGIRRCGHNVCVQENLDFRALSHRLLNYAKWCCFLLL